MDDQFPCQSTKNLQDVVVVVAFLIAKIVIVVIYQYSIDTILYFWSTEIISSILETSTQPEGKFTLDIFYFI